MTARIFDFLELSGRRRGVWPLREEERALPDDWLALLDQLHGQAEPGAPLPVERRA